MGKYVALKKRLRREKIQRLGQKFIKAEFILIFTMSIICTIVMLTIIY